MNRVLNDMFVSTLNYFLFRNPPNRAPLIVTRVLAQVASDPGAGRQGDPAVGGAVDGLAEPLQRHGQRPEDRPGTDQRVSTSAFQNWWAR